MKVLVANKASQILFTNMLSECITCARECEDGSRLIECRATGSKRRIGRLRKTQGDVVLCSDNSDQRKSKKLFSALLGITGELFPALRQVRESVEEIAQKRASRVIHNLKTLNAHSLQEIYALLPQDQIASRDYGEQVTLASKIVRNDPKRTAKTLLRLNKHNIAMKCEFGSFSKVFDRNSEASKRPHAIRRVVLNTLHTFFPDFTDKRVFVDVDQNSDMVPLDYESFQAALFHLVDNAAKYVLDGTTLKVRFSRTEKTHIIRFEMTSIAIPDPDSETIFEEGFSSESARKLELSGDGLGMGLTRSLIEYNGGWIEMECNIASLLNSNHNGIEYQRNCFSIVLPAE
jgi:signal transduction histidine kinase